VLLPLSAWGTESSPKLPVADRASNLLPLPPIPYLDSMRWMSWKSSAPLPKIYAPLRLESAPSGVFQIPTEYVRTPARTS
jgi:hypothetical protein